MKKTIKQRFKNLYTAKSKITQRECQICDHPFSVRSPFRRFCDRCRKNNELYLTSEWLPETTVLL